MVVGSGLHDHYSAAVPQLADVSEFRCMAKWLTTAAVSTVAVVITAVSVTAVFATVAVSPKSCRIYLALVVLEIEQRLRPCGGAPPAMSF